MTQAQENSRYGFYYYPDTLHYAQNDLHRWIPELQALNAGWLTLLGPTDRAIPEAFIRALIDTGIQPIIHIPLPTTGNWNIEELIIFFEAYAHWGVNYISLFDRPNQLKSWSPSGWTQKNLVERFLDIYIPIAHKLLEIGITPCFPPLEPGGDYWDTAFLYTALQGIQRRGESELLNRLVLCAYAWSGNRSPNWGSGGPERWPNTRPYSTPQNSEDHLGFRIFDWYMAVSQAVLGWYQPIILLASGSCLGDQPDPRSPAVDLQAHTWQNMTLVQLMSDQSQEYDPVPPEVLTCNFWLLSAGQEDPEVNNAWYKPDRNELPVVAALKEWVSNQGTISSKSSKVKFSSNIPGYHPISHYLLLADSTPGSTDYRLEAIRPFINKFQPTIGFSPVEASHAKKVTIISGTENIPESIIDGLLAAGCIVEQINGDGMNIATFSTSLPTK